MTGNTNGDWLRGVVKVNGGDRAPAQNLTLTMDFWTLTTGINILPLSAGGTFDTVTTDPVTGYVTFTPGSQSALNKLIEIISLRGQPIIQAAPTAYTVKTTGTPPVTTYTGPFTFKFAIEHVGSWAIVNADGSVKLDGATNLAQTIAAAGVNYGFAADTVLSAFTTNADGVNVMTNVQVTPWLS